MTAYYWIGGAGTQAWNGTANWSLTRGGASAGAAPGAGDTVYVLDGNSQISGGDFSGTSYANIYVDFSPYGSASSVPPLSIGSPANPLKFTIASGGTAKFTGGYGDMYLGPVFAASSSSIQLLGSGNHNLIGTAASGAGTIVAGGVAGKVNIGADYGGSFLLRGMGASVEMAATALSGTAVPTVDDGYVVSYRNIGTTTVGGGVLRVGGMATVSSVTVMPGKTYIHASSGTITTIEVRTGATAVAGSGPFTVANSTVYGSGVIFPNSAGITYTNPTQVFSGGGLLPE